MNVEKFTNNAAWERDIATDSPALICCWQGWIIIL
jgi:hypothetical protein